MTLSTRPAASVAEAVDTRRSVRAFLDRQVPKAQVERLLTQAARAPSGGNLQPWLVHVLAGERLKGLIGAVQQKIAEGQVLGEGADYEIYPKGLKEPYRTRRFQIGEAMYGLLGIPREDKLARAMQFADNFRFFGAPVGMIVTIDRQMNQPQFSDLGMFLQTLMLLARAEGLHSCAQEAWAVWKDTIASYLGLPDEQMVFCGLALGYADPVAPVNQLRSERAPLAEWAVFEGFEGEGG